MIKFGSVLVLIAVPLAPMSGALAQTATPISITLTNYAFTPSALDGQGGEVGPALNGIAADKEKDRRYLLESVVYPNAKIAKGFDELAKVGLIEPSGVRISGAQAAGCSPVATAFAWTWATRPLLRRSHNRA